MNNHNDLSSSNNNDWYYTMPYETNSMKISRLMESLAILIDTNKTNCVHDAIGEVCSLIIRLCKEEIKELDK